MSQLQDWEVWSLLCPKDQCDPKALCAETDHLPSLEGHAHCNQPSEYLSHPLKVRKVPEVTPRGLESAVCSLEGEKCRARAALQALDWPPHVLQPATLVPPQTHETRWSVGWQGVFSPHHLG